MGGQAALLTVREVGGLDAAGNPLALSAQQAHSPGLVSDRRGGVAAISGALAEHHVEDALSKNPETEPRNPPEHCAARAATAA